VNHKTKLSPRDITIAITILSVVVLNACSVPGQTPVSAKSTMPAAASATRDPGQPALRSYSLHMVYTYESKDAKGAAKKGGIELTQEIIVATRDQHVTSRSSGSATSAASTVSYETFLVDGISYLFNPFETGDQKCVRLATRQPAYDNPLLFKPAEIFASLKSPRLIKQGDDIDGIMADQYSVNENDFTQGLFTSAIGNIWVAQDGRYVVKYAVEGIGPSMFSTSSALDKITWAYKLSDINQVTTLSLPTECNSATAAEDIPAPDDAANKNNEGPLFTYDTGLTPAKIGEYYRTTLKAQGWTESSSTLDTLYTFTKEGRTLSIFTTKQTNGYHVMVTDTNVR
jgi:hypothetical protein